MKIPEPVFTLEERVAMATRCRDCDSVPKVSEAGQVFDLPEVGRVQVMHNGLKVVAGGYYGDWMLELIRLCRGHHETQEERLFHEVEKRLPDNARMIELGGFWSYYSLWFLMNHPDRRSVVIEPEPTHLEIGKANARINGLSPTFKAGFAGGTYAEAIDFECEASGWMQLPRLSVDHLMREQGWDRLDLLHADIQGAETEVLESCRDMFKAGKIGWVFVSTHAHQITGDPLTHQRCLSILRECGATIEAEHDVHESFSGDGLIVARFDPAPRDWVPVELSSNRASQSNFRHLAFDLAESQREVAALRAAARPPVHESLAEFGALLTLRADGPLGQAGASLLLPDDKVMAPGIRANASWEIGNVEAFARHVSPEKGYVLVDIGANIGLFTRQLVRLRPSIQDVVCVEPDPENFKALGYNLSDIGVERRLFRAALAKDDGTVELLRDSENFGNYSLNPDAMRERPFNRVEVEARATGPWMTAQLGEAAAILWKSDTQGYDELIVAETPIDIWRRVEVALLEMWRIEKPEYDREAFRARLEDFPHRRLGEREGVGVDDILHYVDGNDWAFEDLLLWR